MAAYSYYSDTGQFPPDDDIYVHLALYPGRGADFFQNLANVAGWDGPYLERWPSNPYWKTERGVQEEGYQMEGTGPTGGYDFDGDGINDPHIEIGLCHVPIDQAHTIAQNIDNNIDDGDIYTGNMLFRDALSCFYRRRAIY